MSKRTMWNTPGLSVPSIFAIVGVVLWVVILFIWGASAV